MFNRVYHLHPSLGAHRRRPRRPRHRRRHDRMSRRHGTWSLDAWHAIGQRRTPRRIHPPHHRGHQLAGDYQCPHVRRSGHVSRGAGYCGVCCPSPLVSRSVLHRLLDGAGAPRLHPSCGLLRLAEHDGGGMMATATQWSPWDVKKPAVGRGFGKNFWVTVVIGAVLFGGPAISPQSCPLPPVT